MKPQKTETAEKLRHYRESCALSQQQVADALNINRTTYTKYETAKTEPAISTLVTLAKIFNVETTALLPKGDDEDKRVRTLREAARADSPIYQLSKDERGLIARYRALSREKKKQALKLMGNMSKKDE